MSRTVGQTAARFTISVFASVLIGCAHVGTGVPAGHGSRSPVSVWSLDELAAASSNFVVLRSDEQVVGSLRLEFLRAADNAAKRVITSVAGMPPEVVVLEGKQPNAFAFYKDSRPVIAVNIAMVNVLTDDEPAWAALFGHEFAHLTLRHQQARVERLSKEQAGSNLLALALSLAGIPFASLITDGATTLVERGYSRDDERDADRTSVTYLLRANYDPQGAVRLHEKLASLGGGSSVSFLSTHPSGGERVETMRRLVDEITRTTAQPEPAK